ncbi:MAG: hypothetical protein HY674_09085 [Chloroflexi bacterium]|nr:hypothetical protein [Chloroflexota bacterium]
MNSTKALLANRASVLILTGAVLFRIGQPSRAQDIQHLTVTQPGGMPGMPLMTGIERETNGVSVTWYGPPGYYQLLQKLGLMDRQWQPVGGLNLTNKATITTIHGSAIFRVLGPSPQYAGSQACLECHSEVHNTQMNTSHAGAFANGLFAVQGGQTNSSCLPCHTVGSGLPTGFASQSETPHLAGVQCESCHGPGANHAANTDDPTAKPRLELAATVCGGCHNAQFVPAQAAAAHHPYYEEWNTSAHRAVLDELKGDFASSRGSSIYIPTCGRCHSGTVREAFLKNKPLPDAHEAGAVGIVCATCHDPHSNYVHTNVLSGVLTNILTGVIVTNNQLGAVYTDQLRNPLSSLQDYHTAGNFTTNYNAEINVCGQCHNDRGALSSSTARPPHHSPQYNMLLGTFRELDTGVPADQPATHALLEKQCVSCHMHTADYVSAAQPAVAGHKFKVESFDTCRTCHPLPELLVQFTTTAVSNQIQQVKAALNFWAASKAPASLRAQYGTRAWEYTAPGDLSPGGPGPTSDEQAAIPVNIQKARFNLYLVLYDGSYGAHNGPYAIALLDTAYNRVLEELNK